MGTPINRKTKPHKGDNKNKNGEETAPVSRPKGFIRMQRIIVVAILYFKIIWKFCGRILCCVWSWIRWFWPRFCRVMAEIVSPIVIAIATAVSIFVLIEHGRLFQGQLDEMKTAGDVTKGLVTATNKYADSMSALVQITRDSQRPVVNVTRAEITGSLDFSKGGNVGEIQFTLTNDGLGRTKASTYAKLFLGGARNDVVNIANEQKKICETARTRPQRDIVEKGGNASDTVTLSATRVEITRGTQSTMEMKNVLLGILPLASQKAFVVPYVIGCVVFTNPGASGGYSRREFIGNISKKNSDAITPDVSLLGRDLEVQIGTTFSN